MCRFISFFHNPITGDVAVSDLNSHGETQKVLNLGNQWREGHYLPDESFELRLSGEDRVSQDACNERFKNRFPSFATFFNWAICSVCKDGVFDSSLDLSSLTSAAGLKLPNEISGSLDLRSEIKKEYLVIVEKMKTKQKNRKAKTSKS